MKYPDKYLDRFFQRSKAPSFYISYECLWARILAIKIYKEHTGSLFHPKQSEIRLIINQAKAYSKEKSKTASQLDLF